MKALSIAGVDIQGGYGQAILAPADGVVEEAEVHNGYGKTVVLNHGYGYSTLFGHMSGFAVTVGQHVQRGDVIGYVGESGRATGPHVHYEVHINDVPVNPHKYMRTTVNSPDFARADKFYFFFPDFFPVGFFSFSGTGALAGGSVTLGPSLPSSSQIQWAGLQSARSGFHSARP